MAAFHNAVRLYDYVQPGDVLTFNLPATLTTADVGKAVTLDATGANKAKLAGEGDIILGRIETVEVRSATQVVGAIALRGVLRLPVGAAETVAIGDSVVGDGSATGAVKAAAAADPTDNLVVEMLETNTIAVVLKR